MSLARQLALWILATAASALCTGCFLNALGVKDTGSGVQFDLAMHVDACGFPAPEVVECNVAGEVVSMTAPAALLLSISSLIYDPLILEVPATASTFSGFIQVKGGFGIEQSLVFKTGLASIPVDRNTTLVAEPGTQLVIVDLPPGLARTFDATISLHYIDLGHAPIKAILALKVPVGGTTYYAPMLPCVTDFADVPAVHPGGLTLAQLPALLAGVSGCDHKSYDFGDFAPPPAANYQGLWWKFPASSESGWGLNLAHQGDKIFASWFTYDTMGRDWWLVMTADKTGPGTYTGKLYQTRGPAFNSTHFDPAAVVATQAGTGTLTFTDPNNGTFAYVIGTTSQTKTITREQFGTLPTCIYGGAPNLALATNFQDLWWAAPANSESGWGINLNHEGDTIFATWFTYDLDGSPLWLVVTAPRTGPGVYSGDLYETSGARFDAFRVIDVKATKVGTATFTFTDGNTATFSYTVKLSGMASPVTQSKTITRELFSATGTACS